MLNQHLTGPGGMLILSVTETPLWSLIGGTKEIVPVGADIPVLSSTDELLKRVEISIQRGFPRIKLKFNRQCTVDMIKQVRNAFPRLIMHIDCNSGFTLDDIAMFQELDKLDLKMIEQPLSYDDLVDHAELRKTIQTPICLDESITSLHRAKKAIKIGACDWINIKTSRVGGLTNGIAIHDLCEGKWSTCLDRWYVGVSCWSRPLFGTGD